MVMFTTRVNFEAPTGKKNTKQTIKLFCLKCGGMTCTPLFKRGTVSFKCKECDTPWKPGTHIASA